MWDFFFHNFFIPMCINRNLKSKCELVAMKILKFDLKSPLYDTRFSIMILMPSFDKSEWNSEKL